MFIKIRFNNLFYVATLVLLMVFFVSSVIIATSKDDIVHPVIELGGCNNEAECRAYCEQRDNADILRTCLSFAKKHNLLPAEVIFNGEKFIDVAVKGGPGGCRDEKSCVSYCDNPAYMTECLDFAIRYDLIPQDELQEAQKVLGALKSGLKTPGSCANKGECIAYCENPAHIDECLAFAEKSGVLPADEIAEARKVAPFLKSGQTPGACKSKTECEAYCSNEANFEECISFAEKAGFMTEKEAGFAKRFKGKSPGDCAKGLQSASQARRACTEFCNNPVNQPTCFAFAQEAGIMTTEEATQAGSLSDFQACLPQAPPEIQKCFIDNMGPELFEVMKQGVLPLDGDIEEMMQKIRESRRCVNRYADKSLQTFTDDPDVLSCINSELGADYLKRASQGQVKCGEAAPSQKKIESCIEAKLGEKIDHCFSLACSEATTCIQSIQKRGSGAMDMMRKDESNRPEIFQKLEAKLNSCLAEGIRGCLVKDCNGMLSCINSFQSGSGGQEGEGSGGSGGLDPALEKELNAKIAECTQLQQQGGQQTEGQRSLDVEKYILEQKSSTQQVPTAGQSTQSSDQTLPDYCSSFVSTPSCSYVGPVDSENYKYCKQCFPDK